MNTYNHYINGKVIATYQDTPVFPYKRRTLAECIRAAKRSRTDAKLIRTI